MKKHKPIIYKTDECYGIDVFGYTRKHEKESLCGTISCKKKRYKITIEEI